MRSCRPNSPRGWPIGQIPVLATLSFLSLPVIDLATTAFGSPGSELARSAFVGVFLAEIGLLAAWINLRNASLHTRIRLGFVAAIAGWISSALGAALTQSPLANGARWPAAS
ncbi:MAG: hypothetical protein CMO80_10955 [Verrucomicrobiales bacterium]|nr:hypothetical protein [Verrucomicrobiales bacterium]